MWIYFLESFSSVVHLTLDGKFTPRTVATDFQRKLDEASKRKLANSRMEVAPESLQQLRSLVTCSLPSKTDERERLTRARGEVPPEAETALQQLLKQSSEAEAKRSLQTLSMILQNLVSHPTQEKYKAGGKLEDQ